MPQEEHRRSSFSKAILWVIAGPFVLYLATIPIIARIAGQPAWTAPVWSAESPDPIWARAVMLLFGLSGVTIALLAPAVAWVLAMAGGRLHTASLFHRAFAFNLIQATAFISLWKMFTGSVPPRPFFIAWQALIAFSGLVVLLRSRQRYAVRRFDDFRPLIIGVLVLLLLLPVFMWDKTFVEDGSGDGTEAFEFSRSLSTHQLPYWDLENGYYGFYPQFMLFAYPTQLSFIAIGETEAAQRLPVFFYLLGIYLVMAEFVRRSRKRLSWTEILLLTGGTVFFLIYHAHLSTYEIVSDVAEPAGVDIFFTFLAASAFYALVTRRRAWWGILALFSSMALAAGLPFMMLLLAARILGERPRLSWPALRHHVLDTLAFVFPWLGYQLFVVIYSRFYPLGTPKWSLGTIFTQYPLEFLPAAAADLAVSFAIVVAVVPVLALGFVLSRDKTIRTLGLAVIGYFVILAMFARLHPHYLIPISLFPGMILLRALAAPHRSLWIRRTGQFVYGALLVVLMVLVFPRDRTPHTAFREFGSRTLMLYDSYPAVVRAAEHLLVELPELYVHLPNGKPVFPWQPALFAVAGEPPSSDERYIEGSLDSFLESRQVHGDKAPLGLSHHLWVRYSDRTPAEGRDYDQILAAPHLAPQDPHGLSRRDLPEGWVLLYRPERSIFAPPTPVAGENSANE